MDAIAGTATGRMDKPVDDVVIDSIGSSTARELCRTGAGLLPAPRSSDLDQLYPL